MAETLTHRPLEKPLMALNANKRRSNVIKLQPTVIVRRPNAVPDRQHEAKGPSTPAQLELPKVEPPQSPVRAKVATAETRAIAIARVRALVSAGNDRESSLEKVGKELGYSAGALNKWLVAAGKEEMAKKKKSSTRTPESIAKQRATIAAKKKANRARAPRSESKAAFVNQHPTIAAAELVKLAAKSGIKLSASYIYNIRSGYTRGGATVRPPAFMTGGDSIGDLLARIKEATAEIERRLTALSL